MKRIDILQSNYIPWKGCCDIVVTVDESIPYDDMQFMKRDWHKRNQTEASQDVQWLTAKLQVNGKYHQKIRKIEIVDSEWVAAHWDKLSQNCRCTPSLWRGFNHGVTSFDLLNKRGKYVHRYIGYLHS
jgi:hypothetical protein